MLIVPQVWQILDIGFVLIFVLDGLHHPYSLAKRNQEFARVSTNVYDTS